MPKASRAASQWSRQGPLRGKITRIRCSNGAEIKEPRERSGNAGGIASGTSAVGRAGADIKEPRERSGNTGGIASG
ncbi:MAG: hypothetical protein IKO67_00340 [Bacteroidaceae bacterium]|nr:hypothetical protein [Bacteroidaceae bacterium]MBR4648586.1 hypothetical protein [Bacteroidaceae bacterium]